MVAVLPVSKGKVWFIEGALPGETVKVKPIRGKRKYSLGITEAGPRDHPPIEWIRLVPPLVSVGVAPYSI